VNSVGNIGSTVKVETRRKYGQTVTAKDMQRRQHKKGARHITNLTHLVECIGSLTTKSKLLTV